jgi:hypothetical protein
MTPTVVPINSGFVNPLFEFDGVGSGVLLLVGVEFVLEVGDVVNVEGNEVVGGMTVGAIEVSGCVEDVGAACVEVGAAVCEVVVAAVALFTPVYHRRINLCPQERM